jgi:hypothetical protein
LIIVLVGLGGWWLWSWLSSPELGGVLGLGGEPGADYSDLLSTEVVELRADALLAHASEHRPGRDPFRFAPAERPSASPPVHIPPPTTVVRQPVPRAEETLEPLAAAKPTPPPVDVKYLGYLGPRDRQIAVLVDEEGIYNAMAGEIVKGKFRVDEIGLETVVLSFVGFPDAEPARLVAGG